MVKLLPAFYKLILGIESSYKNQLDDKYFPPIYFKITKEEEMKSFIRMFKAVLLPAKSTSNSKSISKQINRDTINYGFILSPNIFANFSEQEVNNIVKIVKKELGLSGKEMNSTFHKSWHKVATASDEQLFIEQILHYFTTYGYEALGINGTVYIPVEELKIPKLEKSKIPVMVITAQSKEELKSRLITILNSGIAVSDNTKEDLVDVSLALDISEEDIEGIKNKEVKCMLYSYLGKFPSNNVEFLRFLIYTTINKTLLIKDRMTINSIKESDTLQALGLLKKYEKKYTLKPLAEIFYRFKPLFLAFKTSITGGKHSGMPKVINRIRKLAIKNHKPMKEDLLNSLTGKIKNSEDIDYTILVKELNKVNIFRKIRLANALQFRTTNCESILYKIRNGKSFATEFNFPGRRKSKLEEVRDIVLTSIASDLNSNLKGKQVYIPETINYALPSTEKMFTDYLPSGTRVSVNGDMVFGVHWTNQEGEYVYSSRVDLDLSLIQINGTKIGWDGKYRGGNSEVLFSGDLTDAPLPDGASELFYIKKGLNRVYLVNLNYFLGNGEVPIKIMIGNDRIDMHGNNRCKFVIDPNKIVAVTNSTISETQKQKIIGVLVSNAEGCHFYFSETGFGNNITSKSNIHTDRAREFLISSNENAISLNDVLKISDVKITKDKEKCDIDLSPESLAKDTFMNILKKD